METIYTVIECALVVVYIINYMAFSIKGIDEKSYLKHGINAIMCLLWVVIMNQV